ncbi:hypothetical protein EVAR_59482_1 [Eumeta japonica]|uniref:Uncharacterized protein n=1 Tax=Eumeta variegata TaxID=151549 RepID=A0A4C1Z0Q8_EUMVA|nr:hypothetical protein EVAR_59482_1 [Eumeta japonica]
MKSETRKSAEEPVQHTFTWRSEELAINERSSGVAITHWKSNCETCARIGTNHIAVDRGAVLVSRTSCLVALGGASAR